MHTRLDVLQNGMPETTPYMPLAKRWVLFASWMGLFALLFSHSIVSLVRMSLSQDDSSYLLAIPCVSAWILFAERRKLFVHLSYGRARAAVVFSIAVCVVVASRALTATASPDVQLSGYILSLVLFWISGFVLIFGNAVWDAARFPLLFMLMMAPLPDFILDRVIHLLQVGSAWITEVLFNMLNVPVLREGLVFHLASVNIEVAKECSGIRSSMAVLIITLLIVHFSLKTFWKKSLFLLAGLFIMIVKNGIRIATLTLLAMYVDPGFLYGRLHRQGGVVFFVIGLLLLVPILKLLQYGEHPAPKAQNAEASLT